MKKTSKKTGKKAVAVKKATKVKPKAKIEAKAPVKPVGGYAVEVENIIRDKDNGNIVSSNYIPYVGSKKMPLKLIEAEGHRDGLKRAGSGGRIVSVPDNQVHETWDGVVKLEQAQREQDANQTGSTLPMVTPLESDIPELKT